METYDILDKRYYKKLSTNKSLEIQLSKWDNSTSYFTFKIGWTRKCDHAGFEFTFSICKYWLDFKIYDHRHWDWNNNCYMKYDTDMNYKR